MLEQGIVARERLFSVRTCEHVAEINSEEKNELRLT